MAEKIPFDEDVMTMFMGLGGPEEPGQHGRTLVEPPDQEVVSFITDIRDMCEDFLRKIGKYSEDKTEEKDDNMEDDTETADMEEE